MESSDSISAGTRAITIPSYGTSSYAGGREGAQGRTTQTLRPKRVDRMDSDIGTASGSSVGSDWASSPTSGPASARQRTATFQVSIASPPTAVNHTYEESREHKGKQRAISTEIPLNTISPTFTSPTSSLGPSMLSSSAYKSVNLNNHYDPESKEPARLITYTKHSQGFTWNDELFLPSYLLGRHRYRGHGRRRWGGENEDDDIGDFEEEGERCPVTDIFVTDEEAAAMMP